MANKLIKRGSAEPNPIDFQRLIRRKLGATTKEIAVADGITEKAALASVNAAEIYLDLHSLEHVNAAVGRIVQNSAEKTQKTLHRSLEAKLRTRDKKGRVHIEEDFSTQLRAVGEFTSMVEAIQPKGGKGVTVNANSTANAQATAFSEENYQPGFEELIDTIRTKVERQNLIPREVGTTTDDVVLDGGELEENSAEDPSSDNEEAELDDSAEASP